MVSSTHNFEKRLGALLYLLVKKHTVLLAISPVAKRHHSSDKKVKALHKSGLFLYLPPSASASIIGRRPNFLPPSYSASASAKKVTFGRPLIAVMSPPIKVVVKEP